MKAYWQEFALKSCEPNTLSKRFPKPYVRIGIWAGEKGTIVTEGGQHVQLTRKQLRELADFISNQLANPTGIIREVGEA